MEPDDTLPFRPFPLLGNPHLQTILGSVLRLTAPPPSAARRVELDDGDALVLEVSTPRGWRPQDPSAVLVHGLCGCHRSGYVVRLSRKLFHSGIRAVRLNLRGCGSGFGLARSIYHSGSSDDVLAALRDLQREHRQSPLSLIGFSLGGNIVLKLASELGDEAPDLLRRVIAVCPPADLEACAQLLHRPRSRIYERYFIRHLLEAAELRYRRYPELRRASLRRGLSIMEFDDIYTAPSIGARDARDYYSRASAAPRMHRIRVPCRVVFSVDDPFVDAAALDDVEIPDCVQVVKTSRGGHLGFLGLPWSAGGFRWLDNQILRWTRADEPSPAAVRKRERV